MNHQLPPMPPTYGPGQEEQKRREYQTPRQIVRVYDTQIPLWSSWDVPSVRNALDAHAMGSFYDSALLYDQIESDDAYSAAMEKRVLGLTSRPRIVKPNPRCSDQRLARRAADMIRERDDEIVPLEIIDFVVRNAVGMGFAPLQNVWWHDEGMWWPRLQPWQLSLCQYRMDIRRYVTNTMAGQVAMEPGDSQWIIHTPFGQYRGWMRGAVRSCAIPWLARQYGLRDWMRYSEAHGLPLKKLKVPAAAPDQQKERFWEKMSATSGETTVELPQGVDNDPSTSWDIELLEAQANTWEGFKELLDKCESRFAIRLLGQNLTSEVSDQGARSAVEAHASEQSTFSRADNRQLKATFKTQLWEKWAEFNFGDKTAAPLWGYDLPDPDDEDQHVTRVVSIAGAIGQLVTAQAPVDVRAMLKRYDIPVLPEGAAAAAPPEPPPSPTPAPSVPPQTEPAKPPAPREPADGQLSGQLYLDAMHDHSRDEIASVLKPTVDAVREAVRTSRGYSELRDSLRAIAPKLQPDAFAQLMGNALTMAHLAGRAAVHDDHGQS